jgi:hypothetical protein
MHEKSGCIGRRTPARENFQNARDMTEVEMMRMVYEVSGYTPDAETT